MDSGTWRHLERSELASRALRSRTFRAADTARRYVATSARAARDPGVFRHVETFCAFIGPVKSGGTLLASLLDAHPNAVFADEVDVLRYVAAGFRRDQIFHLLLRGARQEAMKGRVTARRLEPYSFRVGGQWQGRHADLRVIGESRGGPTTRRLGTEPELLERLTERMAGVRTGFIHVVRNPYDPISAMILRGKRSFPDAIRDVSEQFGRLVELRGRIEPADLLTVRYEDLVREPVEGLRRACSFLGLEAEEGYLRGCAAIVDPSFRRERDRVEWGSPWIGAVGSLIEEVPFLHGYTFEG